MHKHYLYRHIRLDKNEPFYIGIGTVELTKEFNQTASVRYSRAYSKKRNRFWKNVVSKTPYEVEVMLESDDYEFLINKEKEFISLYGRADLGQGPLCNLTEGGEGTVGTLPHMKSIARRSKPVVQLILEGNFLREWPSISSAARFYKIKPGHISSNCKGRLQSVGGYIWKYKENYVQGSNYSYKTKCGKPVYRYDKEGNLIDEFSSAVEAAKKLKAGKNGSSNILCCVNGRTKHAYGFVWKNYKQKHLNGEL